MWRLRVVHSTGYAYKSAVTASFNEARLTPRSDSRQNVILNRVETVPATRSYRYVDYWGTAVTAFDLHAPHTELEVTSTSVVETDRGDMPKEGASWDDLRSEAVIDRFDDVLVPTHYTPQSKRIRRWGSGSPNTTILAGRHRRRELGAQRTRIRRRHHRRALIGFGRASRRQGRLPGLRAPYADPVARHGHSGALCFGLFASQQKAKVGDTIDGQSHAWVQAWTGGWWNYDPTNDADINEQYVSVGVGRDYADVSPLKGIYSGEGSTDLDVVVEITRLA